MDIELEIGEVKPEWVEIYDIKKKANLEKFRQLTSELSKCFETNAPNGEHNKDYFVIKHFQK